MGGVPADGKKRVLSPEVLVGKKAGLRGDLILNSL